MKKGFLWNHGEMTNQLLVTLGGRVECTQFGGIPFEIELKYPQFGGTSLDFVGLCWIDYIVESP